ncbi:hypothetical protein Alches_15540 [Alicyclobacillus hesperidum subsp. aegles]|uniref:hypothetical protein n=1 Tax=Alicyclobacillus hesperidum TaxID=89784 RepID=UPI00222BDE03|nr:hypothetical protein [Alicyclobacillus hesperidum]GLG01515.1 hypothetical protein Alches_15540 [Alicyclobacillus hesperidum subsp. aegles]
MVQNPESGWPNSIQLELHDAMTILDPLMEDFEQWPDAVDALTTDILRLGHLCTSLRDAFNSIADASLAMRRIALTLSVEATRTQSELHGVEAIVGDLWKWSERMAGASKSFVGTAAKVQQVVRGLERGAHEVHEQVSAGKERLGEVSAALERLQRAVETGGCDA